MDQALANLSPAALAGLLAAYILAATRIAKPLAPLWARLRAPWPQLIPAIVALLPQVADAFTDVNTWQSFAVSVATAVGLILPGINAKPPQDPPSGENPVGPATPWNDIPPAPREPKIDEVRLSWKLSAVAALGVFLAMVLLPFAAGCSPAPAKAKAPCDEATFKALLVQCNAEAAACVANGGEESACDTICDERADKRREQCE